MTDLQAGYQQARAKHGFLSMQPGSLNIKELALVRGKLDRWEPVLNRPEMQKSAAEVLQAVNQQLDKIEQAMNKTGAITAGVIPSRIVPGAISSASLIFGMTQGTVIGIAAVLFGAYLYSNKRGKRK